MWTTATPKGDSFRADGETSKGTPFVSCIFVLEDGEELWWRGYLSLKAIDRTKKQLTKLGWQGEPMGEWRLSEDPCRVLIEEREFEGTTYKNVAMIATSSSGSGNTSKADQLLGVTRQPDPSGLGDDDIQF